MARLSSCSRRRPSPKSDSAPSRSCFFHFTSTTVDGFGIVGGCCQIINVTGCNGLPVPDVTVNVRSGPGGTILATGAMRPLGITALIWIGSWSTSVWIEAIYGPEFATNGDTYAVTAGETTEISL